MVTYTAGKPDDNPDFERIGELGKGGYGKVYLYRKKSDQQLFAVKEIDFTCKEVAKNDSVKQMLHNEAALLKKFHGLDSEHFVDFLGAYEEKDGNNETAKLYLLIEYLDGIDLDRIRKHQLLKNENVVLVIIREVLKAVKVMHDHGWRHADIKPANIFITKQGTVKLIDLGAAGPVGNDLIIRTREFSSLEVLSCDGPPGRGFFDNLQTEFDLDEQLRIFAFFRRYEQIDIYSVGETIESISDPSLVDIIEFSKQHLTQPNPCFRQTAASLLEHQMIAQCNGKKLAVGKDFALTVVDV